MKTKIFAMAIAALALAACDKNNDDFTVDNLKDTPLTIASAGVAELTTRAITEGQLVGSVDENVSISVWVEGSAEKFNANNVEWVHDGTDWYSNSTVLYEGEDKHKGSKRKSFVYLHLHTAQCCCCTNRYHCEPTLHC